MISPGYFKDRFMDTFGPVAYVHELCGNYFAVFLKLILYVVVIVKCHLEITKIICASPGFSETLLNASYDIFLTSVSTTIYEPRAPPFVVDEEERKALSNNVDLSEIREGVWKNKQQFYPVLSPAQCNPPVLPISWAV